MRILYLNHNVVGTGTYQRASSFARELARGGHEVTLVTTSRTRRVRANERHVESLHVIEAPDLLTGAARTGWDVWNTLWRTRRLALEHFDLVHAFDCRPAVLMPALVQRRRTGASLFFDWADWWGRGGTINERSGRIVRTLVGPLETWLEESFRVNAAGNTTISEALRDRCVALGAPADRVLVLPNGCVRPSATRARAAHARTALGLTDAPLLLHLGVMQRADCDFLMAAFRLLRARNPRVRLALIGNYRGDVPDDVSESVHRVGYVTGAQLQLWLAAADVGVVPLRDTIASRGRWPGKVNEYLSAGLTTVMPAIGDAAEVLAAAQAARVCEATPSAFAAALEEVLADSDGRARMSSNALALAAGPLSWPTLTRQLLAFYEAASTRAVTTANGSTVVNGSRATTAESSANGGAAWRVRTSG